MLMFVCVNVSVNSYLAPYKRFGGQLFSSPGLKAVRSTWSLGIEDSVKAFH